MLPGGRSITCQESKAIERMFEANHDAQVRCCLGPIFGAFAYNVNALQRPNGCC